MKAIRGEKWIHPSGDEFTVILDSIGDWYVEFADGEKRTLFWIDTLRCIKAFTPTDEKVGQ